MFTVLCFGGAAAEVVLYQLCVKEKMAYMQGFLTAVPIAVVMFWFSCFFDDITYVKNGSKHKYVIKKIPRKVISILLRLLCAAALVFWLYIYHTNIARLF